MNRKELSTILCDYYIAVQDAPRQKDITKAHYKTIRRINKLIKVDCMDCHLDKYEYEEVVKYFKKRGGK